MAFITTFLATIGWIVLGFTAATGRLSMFMAEGAVATIVVIGGSGTGKSVMLKCVLGLLKPEQGRIKVDGEEVTGMGDVINDLIVQCVQELGAAALSITHDLASARKIADRIAMIYKGRIIWAGPVDQVDDFGNAHVDQFIHGRADGPIQMEVLRP